MRNDDEKGIPRDVYEEERDGFRLFCRNETNDEESGGNTGDGARVEGRESERDETVGGTVESDTREGNVPEGSTPTLDNQTAVPEQESHPPNETENISPQAEEPSNESEEDTDSEILSEATKLLSIKPPTPPITPLAEPKHLMTLPWPVRTRIILRVLDIKQKDAYTSLEALSPLPAILRTCQQLRAETRRILFLFPLRIRTPLRSDIGLVTQWKRYAINLMYGSTINELRLVVHVVHEVFFTNPRRLANAILAQPGVSLRSHLLIPEMQDDVVTGLHTTTAPVLAHRTARGRTDVATDGDHPQHNLMRFTFAPVNHAHMFAWPAYASVAFENLTIEVRGAMAWHSYSFAPRMQHHRVLPIVALIASVIAHRPVLLKSVTIMGLAVYEDMFSSMWEAVPARTPITGVHWLLDELVAYPFAGAEGMTEIMEVCFDGQGGLMKREREGCLWGVRTKMQWQARVMKERWGKHSAKWRFVR
ncbi:hypothetical protein K491DRAFT_717535 [Lophiostoma macrostomum CBS 122681]|uniref:F-box domain-containing protein n=1 Tax=Lophiostoma macrostomum CBS 122681 TaxID=1314788 RepID=A0A6A6T5A2_9PLEO|nr:hypothetical protein K491DRAFT_717535 [Lophiostoma macrostomum CBS 122681]